MLITPILLLLLPANKARAGRRRSGRRDAGYGRTTRSQEASQAVLGWVLGLVLLTGAIAAVAGYEVYWARVMKPQREGLAAAVPISPDTPDPANEGKVVHVVGRLAGVERLTDPGFGVAVEALKLRRRVWMRQWEQRALSRKSSLSKTDEKGNTVWKIESKTYDYSPMWSESVIDSKAFHNAGHDNPAVKKIPDLAACAASISLGAFTLSPELVEQIDSFETVPLGDGNLAALAEAARTEAKLADGEVYFGADPRKPAIGDLKVRIEMAPAATVSVIARQNGHNLSPCSVGNVETIARLRVGTHSVQEMTAEFARSAGQERVTIWAVGGVACLLGVIFIRVARGRSRRLRHK